MNQLKADNGISPHKPFADYLYVIDLKTMIHLHTYISIDFVNYQDILCKMYDLSSNFIQLKLIPGYSLQLLLTMRLLFGVVRVIIL
jgi:hypothetical protein